MVSEVNMTISPLPSSAIIHALLPNISTYIQIETEAIRDANDKMMISSYCLSKLEMVNWSSSAIIHALLPNISMEHSLNAPLLTLLPRFLFRNFLVPVQIVGATIIITIFH